MENLRLYCMATVIGLTLLFIVLNTIFDNAVTEFFMLFFTYMTAGFVTVEILIRLGALG